MKQFILIFLFVTTNLYSYLLDDKLPNETTQLIESFECFSKDDRTIIYAYILALKYRMNHINDRDALVKGDLDYWRLWHLVSDMQYKCKLNYQFSRILTETILATKEDTKIHKRLGRLEGSIRTDGTSESSGRMRKYDAKLRKKILKNPPKYTVLPKSNAMENYDLKVLKTYKPNSIPKNIYEQIEDKKLNTHQKDILFRYAYLAEEMIRKYDKPKIRHEVYQEMLYLDECKKIDSYYLKMNFYPNFIRKLSRRVVTSNGYHPLKTEFLPKEVESYCENNITKMKLSTFVLKQEKKTKKKVKKVIAKLENLKKFLSQYDNNISKKKYANEYFFLMKNLLESSAKGTPNIQSLKLLRLQNCLVGDDYKEDFALIMARVKDFRLEGLKEIFYNNIFNSQRWWTTTIRMKIDAEGKSKELTGFFDCNQTLLNDGKMPTLSTKKQDLVKSKFNSSDVRKAIAQKDEILKYYAKLYENKPTPIFSNHEAINKGIISKKWLDKNGNIQTPFGDSVEISGMSDGGIKLTYTGIPKGKLCTDFIQLNKNDVIFFNNNTYEGIDYVIVNDDMIKLKQYVYKYTQKVCSKQDNNTISFVRKNMIVKRKYKQSSLGSAFSKVKKVKTIDTLKHNPYSAAYRSNKENFVVIGSKAKLYDTNMETLIKTLPSRFENSYRTVFSPNGKYLAVGRYGTTIHIWDMQNNKIFKTIKKGMGGVKMFLSDNKTLVLVDKKIHLLDIESENIVGVIEPKFILNKKKYSSIQISAIVESPNKKMLYIANNKNTIEQWKIEKSFLGSERNMEYQSTIENKTRGGIGALIFDNKNYDILIIASKNKEIKFWNIRKNILEKTYVADEYMGCNKIVLSEDHKNMLALGTHGAFLWKLDNIEQHDIIKGGQVVGGMFMNDSLKFILMSRNIDIWEIIQ